MVVNPVIHCQPKNIRRQAKMLYVWYPKNRTDLNIIHKENDIIETLEELANVKKQLKLGTVFIRFSALPQISTLARISAPS